MKLITEGNELNNTLCELIENCEYFSFAVAWASYKTATLNSILTNKNKLKNSVIGTHFFQTDYEVLESFIDNDKVRFMLQPSGVFHPKSYVFWSKNSWDIIIGSANMTNKAFTENQEICVHISSSDSNNQIYTELKEKIKQLWADAEIMTDEKAHEYKIKKIEAKKKLQGILKEKIYNSNYYDNVSPLLKYDWKTYVQIIKNDTRFLQKRCELLIFSQKLFQNYSFNNMQDEERKLLAGINNKYDQYDYGLFGSVPSISNRYCQTIRNNYKGISKALNKIPTNFNTTVTKEDFLNYKKIFLKLFEDNGKGINIATFTRLLVMKRPDYFICINKANSEIYNALGVDEKLFDKKNYPEDSSKIYDNYWDYIIQEIINSTWWQSPRPKDKFEQKIWKYRVAMLDSIFYKG